jgi:peptidoglycan/LPS O-acetylase OafA/YrhL
MDRDYSPVLDDWNPVDAALSAAVGERLLPTPVAQRPPAVRPELLPEPVAAAASLPHDPWPARLVSAGIFVGLAGGGVFLAGQGVRAAGPYLWALAAALGALAGLVALLKSRGASGSAGTTVHVERSRNVRINL